MTACTITQAGDVVLVMTLREAKAVAKCGSAGLYKATVHEMAANDLLAGNGCLEALQEAIDGHEQPLVQVPK